MDTEMQKIFERLDYICNNVYAYAKRSIVLKHNFNIGYKLYLYFGGNKKAPHDITIYQNNI